MNRVNFYILEAKVVACENDSKRKNFENSVMLNKKSTFDAIISGTSIKANPDVYSVYYPKDGYWRINQYQNITHMSINYLTNNIDDEFLTFLIMNANLLTSTYQDVYTSTNI